MTENISYRFWSFGNTGRKYLKPKMDAYIYCHKIDRQVQITFRKNFNKNFRKANLFKQQSMRDNMPSTALRYTFTLFFYFTPSLFLKNI